MHSTGLKSMHENLTWCMHENVNDYADDLINSSLNRLYQKIFPLLKALILTFDSSTWPGL
jgi:hypothetical protein